MACWGRAKEATNCGGIEVTVFQFTNTTNSRNTINTTNSTNAYRRRKAINVFDSRF